MMVVFFRYFSYETSQSAFQKYKPRLKETSYLLRGKTPSPQWLPFPKNEVGETTLDGIVLVVCDIPEGCCDCKIDETSFWYSIQVLNNHVDLLRVCALIIY